MHCLQERNRKALSMLQMKDASIRELEAACARLQREAGERDAALQAALEQAGWWAKGRVGGQGHEWSLATFS